MKNISELLEKLRDDEEFVNKFGKAFKKKLAEGMDDPGAIIAVSGELGYGITESELEELMEKQNENLSLEDLGRVVGGTVDVPSSSAFIPPSSITMGSLLQVSKNRA